jgi:hypothetical protein
VDGIKRDESGASATASDLAVTYQALFEEDLFMRTASFSAGLARVPYPAHN